LLRELIRLGVTQTLNLKSSEAGDKFNPSFWSYLCGEGAAKVVQLFCDDVGDHLAIVARNLMGSFAQMLEQRAIADNLWSDSVGLMMCTRAQTLANGLP
jgi:hypothetical protein